MKRVRCKKQCDGTRHQTRALTRRRFLRCPRDENCAKKRRGSHCCSCHDICVSCEYFVLLLRVRGRLFHASKEGSQAESNDADTPHAATRRTHAHSFSLTTLNAYIFNLIPNHLAFGMRVFAPPLLAALVRRSLNAAFEPLDI